MSTLLHSPPSSANIFAQGWECHLAGDLPAAALTYRSLLQQTPNHFNALHLLGLIELEQGNINEALRLLKQSLQIAQPVYALCNYAVALIKGKQAIEALSYYQQAIQQNPQESNIWLDLASVHYQLHQYPEALQNTEKFLQVSPPSVEYYHQRGNALYALGQWETALQTYQQGLQINPRHTGILYGLANLETHQQHFDLARLHYQTALAFAPEDARLHWNYALLLLLLGEWVQGWQEYEWRWRLNHPHFPSHRSPQPRWQGEATQGKTLLLYTEQGPGESLMFARYAQVLALRADFRIILEVPPNLYRLLEPWSARQMTILPQNAPLPPHDWCCPLMSVPLLLGTQLSTIPSAPYWLENPKESHKKWQHHFSPQTNSSPLIRIGITWTGGQKPDIDKGQYSIPLQKIMSDWVEPLSSPGNIEWVALQTLLSPSDKALLESRGISSPISTSANADLHDFSDIAALINTLDGLISLDTPTAHLAGMLGKPVWILLPLLPNWFWLLERADTRWYPSARLFRQTQTGNWDSPMREVFESLQQALKTTRGMMPHGSSEQHPVQPSTPADNLAEAETLYQIQEYARSEQYCRIALVNNPNPFPVLRLLGLIYLALNRWNEAEECLRQARMQAQDPEIITHHAVALMRQGNLPAALASTDEAIRINPYSLDPRIHRGQILYQLRHLPEALAQYQEILIMSPQVSIAYRQCAMILRDLKKYPEGLEYCRGAIRLSPREAGLYDLGMTLCFYMNQMEEALAFCEQSLVIAPQGRTSRINQANILYNLHRYTEALSSYLQLQSEFPNNADILYNLSLTLHSLRKYSEALPYCEQSIAIRPEFAEAHNLLGNLLQEEEQHLAAINAYNQAITLDPNYADAYINRGNTLKKLRLIQEAIHDYRRAQEIVPHHPNGVFNEGVCMLMLGDWEQGWQRYAGRWDIPAIARWLGIRRSSQPVWDGSQSLIGKTIVLEAEQGLGDTIQYARYAKLVKEQGASHLILSVYDVLLPLFEGMQGVDLLLGIVPLPPHDYVCPLINLPMVFKTRPHNIPGQAYLPVRTDKQSVWLQQLAMLPRPWVGIAWTGNANNLNQRNRAIPLHQLLEHICCPVISLHKEISDEDQETMAKQKGRIHNVSPHLHDFSDTGALISCLDLVISVDTSIVHLSGGLGRPLWILLPYSHHWCWMMDKETTGWYPTARIYRQKAFKEWGAVLDKVEQDLQIFCNDKGTISSLSPPSS